MRILFKHPEDGSLTVSAVNYCSFEENAKCSGVKYSGMYVSYGDSIDLVAVMNKHECEQLCEQLFRTGLLDLTSYNVLFEDDETENASECDELKVF